MSVMSMNGLEDSDHGDLGTDEQHPPWFDRRDKDFAALQKVILEPTLLEIQVWLKR